MELLEYRRLTISVANKKFLMVQRAAVRLPCKLTTIAQLRELGGEICQTFHIVSANERINARNSRARGLGVRPFPASKGETRELTRAARLDVYLTRSNLIKNLIKSDFWAAPESVPNQPRQSNKTRKNFPSPFLGPSFLAPSSRRLWHPLRHKRVSRFESHGWFFPDTCLLARRGRPIWNYNANHDGIARPYADA